MPPGPRLQSRPGHATVDPDRAKTLFDQPAAGLETGLQCRAGRRIVSAVNGTIVIAVTRERLLMAFQEIESPGAGVVGGGEVGLPLKRFGVACGSVLEVALAALCVAPVIVALCRAETRQEVEIREKAEDWREGRGVVLVGACEVGVETDGFAVVAGG